MNYLKADNDRLHKMVEDGSAPAASQPPSSPGSPLSSAGEGLSGLLSNSHLTSPVHHRSLAAPPDRTASSSAGLPLLSHNQSVIEGEAAGKRVTISVVSPDQKNVRFITAPVLPFLCVSLSQCVSLCVSLSPLIRAGNICTQSCYC